MSQKNTSSRLRNLVKSALVAALLPIIFIYIVVAGPDYKLLHGVAHIFVPVVNGIGDFITWPVRLGGNFVRKLNKISYLEQENEKLRAQIVVATADKVKCDVAIIENQKLARELNVAQNVGYENIIADVVFDNSALHHETFLVNRGSNDGVLPGMVAVSFERALVGIVIDSGYNFSRVRSIIDSNTNIAVRIAGSGVYGFLQGNGSSAPTIGFFSDHKFRPNAGVKIVTSAISGVLPPDIFVGEMENDTDVIVTKPDELSRVMILKFNTPENTYK